MSGPEYGPGGYLPSKAAKRARKIVLREQMGWGWPLAAVAASVIVVIAGGWYIVSSQTPPQAPYVAVGPLTQIDPGGAETVTSGRAGATAIVVRAGGGVRAFRAEPGDIVWCPQSRRLETADAAWTPDGRLTYGEGRSLTPLRSIVFNGEVYVDTQNAAPPPPPRPGGDPPVCAG